MDATILSGVCSEIGGQRVRGSGEDRLQVGDKHGKRICIAIEATRAVEGCRACTG